MEKFIVQNGIVLLFIVAILAVFILAGCGWGKHFGIKPDAAETIERIAARRLGQAVVKERPQTAQQIYRICDTIILLTNTDNTHGDRLKNAIIKLATLIEPDNPMLQQDFKDIFGLVDFKQETIPDDHPLDPDRIAHAARSIQQGIDIQSEYNSDQTME